MSVNYKVFRDEERLINLRPLVIYIVVEAGGMSYVGNEIKQMNKYVDYTRNLFKIEPIYRNGNEPNIEDNRLSRAIKYNNLWARMIDIETSPCYFFGHITTHPYYIREELYEFVTEFCRVNIFHIETRLRFADPEKDSELIDKLQILKQCFEEAINQKRTPGLKRWKSSLERWEIHSMIKASSSVMERTRNKVLYCIDEVSDIDHKCLGDSIPLYKINTSLQDQCFENVPVDISHKEALGLKKPSARLKKIKRTILSFDKLERQELWEYMRLLCGDFPNEQTSKASFEKYVNPQFSGAQQNTDADVSIEIKKIKSKKIRYGVEIRVGSNVYPIYMGTTNDRMAYLAILLRHKTNNYLFHHEFYTSRTFNRNRKFSKKASFNWLKSLYRIIEPSQRVDFKDWIAKFELGEGRAMHQAVTNIRRLISDTLGAESANEIYYVVPTTMSDAMGNSYYTVKINSNNIVVAEELRDLVDNFDSYYK